MRALIDKIAEALLKPVSKVVTVLLGIYTIVWGMWVASPAWDTFSHAALYSAMFNFFPHEWLWGVLAIISGVLTLLGIINHFERTMIFGAGIAGLHWFIIAIFYFMGDVANTGGITALFISVLATYIYLNCKVNYMLDNEE